MPINYYSLCQSFFRSLSDDDPQCLKITQNVAFFHFQKFAKNGPFLVFLKLTFT